MIDSKKYYGELTKRIERLRDEMARLWEERWGNPPAYDDRTLINLLNFIKTNRHITDELFIKCYALYLNDSTSLFVVKKHPSWYFFQEQNFNRYSALAPKQERLQDRPAPAVQANDDDVERERIRAIQAIQQMKRQLANHEGLNNGQTSSALDGK